MKKTRRQRKLRRLARMRIKSGKSVVRHKSKSGRTGAVRAHQLKEFSQ